MIDEIALNDGRCLAYVYFDHTRTEKQTAEYIIASLVKQLCGSLRSSLPKSLADLSKKHMKNGTKPSIRELDVLLADVLDAVERAGIVVDALDECEARQRKAIIASLGACGAKEKAQVLVTCRPFITKLLKSDLTINVTAEPSDLAAYISAKVSECETSIPPEFIEELEEKLISSAQHT